MRSTMKLPDLCTNHASNQGRGARHDCTTFFPEQNKTLNYTMYLYTKGKVDGTTVNRQPFFSLLIRISSSTHEHLSIHSTLKCC